MKHSWQQTIIMIILMSGIFAMFVGLVLVVRNSMHKEFENNALVSAEASSETTESTEAPATERAPDAIPPSQRQQAVATEASSAVEKTSEVSAEIEAESGSEAAVSDDPNEIYKEVLDFYREQLENGWTSPEDASELWYWGETPVSADIAGYEFRDMNGDGTPELLLSIKDESPYDSMIYDFYTCIDGEVRHLFSCEEKSTWYLLENNELLFYTSDSDKTAKLARYKLDETGEFVAQEVLIHDGDTWTDHDEFYTKEVGNDPNYHDKDLPNKMSAVMHDTANAIYDHLTEKRIPLELTMFAA